MRHTVTGSPAAFSEAILRCTRSRVRALWAAYCGINQGGGALLTAAGPPAAQARRPAAGPPGQHPAQLWRAVVVPIDALMPCLSKRDATLPPGWHEPGPAPPHGG